MSDNSNFFAMMARMKHVNRWGLMRNTLNESIAEHTLDVIMLSHALIVIANTYFGKNLDGGRACLLAAYHDAPEIMTGDMPTPVKYLNQEIKNAYKNVEEKVIETMVDSLPLEMQGTYDSIFNGKEEGDEELFKFVKAADKLSALIKCIDEEQMGNKDFASAKDSTLRIIKEMKMPELEYFIDHFLPGYYMTLDEQTK